VSVTSRRRAAEAQVAPTDAGTASKRFSDRPPPVAGSLGNGDGIGSPEYLRAAFERAAAAADRAVGLWLVSRTRIVADDLPSAATQGVSGELQTLRTLTRAAATAYVRRLRDDGVTPERMLVLVKTAAGQPGAQGFGARELTQDIVRWSIEAYFDQ